MATQQFHFVFSAPRISPVTRRRSCSVIAGENFAVFPSNLKPISSRLLEFRGMDVRCNSSGDSGQNEFRTVLDAFFLGKAVGEVLTERIESSVGEFLNVIGRLQAEQQKHILEFQEDVLEKARRAKEQASREAMEARGVVSKSTSVGASAVESVEGMGSSVTDSVISTSSSVISKPTNEDPFLGLFNKD